MNIDLLKNYFYTNLITVFWSSFLVLGGLVFVLYYAHIEYMPDFDVASSVMIVAAAAITAIAIVISFLIIMILPGLFWVSTWDEKSALKSYWSNDADHNTGLGITIWFALPLFITYTVVISFQFSGWYAALVAATSILGYFSFLYFIKKIKLYVCVIEISWLTFISAISSMITSLPLWVIFKLVIDANDTLPIPSWVLGIATGSIIVIGNMLIIKFKSLYWCLAISIMLFYFLFSSFQIFHKIPNRVVEIYKFGNIFASELLMKEDACDIFYALKIEAYRENNLCHTKDIKILSRLGREAYLEKDGKRFTIEMDQITSWSKPIPL